MGLKAKDTDKIVHFTSGMKGIIIYILNNSISSVITDIAISKILAV